MQSEDKFFYMNQIDKARKVKNSYALNSVFVDGIPWVLRTDLELSSNLNQVIFFSALTEEIAIKFNFSIPTMVSAPSN